MAYLGSTPTTQSFIAGTDSFNGTGSATNFTLSRLVNSTNDIQVVVNNVVQYPPNYSVSGNTLTISPAPSAGTNNVYVRYLSTTLQSIAPSQGVAIQFGIGSLALPSISFIGDTNTGIYSPAADTLAFVEGGTEAMRIDSSANVGIGTSTPATRLHVYGGDQTYEKASTGEVYAFYKNGIGEGKVQVNNSGQFVLGTTGSKEVLFVTNNTERARIDTSGNFQFNSGYGSVATAFGCRAWVNFNGTGTVAIRASGNVSSITDVGVGIYTVNFTTAMPDANYAPQVAVQNRSTSQNTLTQFIGITASAAPLANYENNALIDIANIFVAVFR